MWMPVVPNLDEGQYQEIAARVARRSGMVFAPNRQVEARAGIARAMKASVATSPSAYLALVQRSTVALDALVDELTVGETHFMRDPAQMDLIRREVLPALRGRASGPRVWSAGCATGEEAYSLAILLEQEGLDTGAFVLGTDLSEAALGKGRTASYSAWSMRGVDARFLESYFRPARRRRILVDRIREKVRFERLNLVGEASFAAVGAYGMDLILCRNVLIYFDHATARRIAARLFESLAEGGVLLTGGADPLLTDSGLFDIEVTRVGLVYRRRRPDAASVSAARLPAALTRPIWLERPMAPEPHDALVAAITPERAETAMALETGRLAFTRVLAQANSAGAEAAEQMVASELARHPLDASLHYLRATLLLALGRYEEAEGQAQRALYLDRSLAVAHFLMGTLLRRRGDVEGALRAFRNVRQLCGTPSAAGPMASGDGACASGLQSAAEAEIERLDPRAR
jgi:chemotaxis protein methyltransferase CheR